MLACLATSRSIKLISTRVEKETDGVLKPEECTREWEVRGCRTRSNSEDVPLDVLGSIILLAWTRTLLKWPGCPKCRHTLLEKFLWLSEWVSLAWSSCMGSSTGADRLGVGPLEVVGEVRRRKPRFGPLPLSLPETVDEVRCDTDQSLEVWCLVSSCKFVLQLLPQPINVASWHRSNHCLQPKCGIGWNIPQSMRTPDIRIES